MPSSYRRVGREAGRASFVSCKDGGKKMPQLRCVSDVGFVCRGTATRLKGVCMSFHSCVKESKAASLKRLISLSV